MPVLVTQPNTIITIFDDDGRFWMIIINFTTIIISIAITIGFSHTAYTVNENLGEIQLPVEVNGAVELKKEVSLNIETRDGSAVGKPTLYIANLPVNVIPIVHGFFHLHEE